MKNKFITKVIEINGELCLVLPTEFTKEYGWKVGDQVVFETIDKDSFKIYKRD